MFSVLPRLRPPLLLLLAILTLFRPVLLNPYLILFPTFSPFSDLMVIHWPKAHLMAQSWQAGHGLPYWTPLILSGMPLAANQLAMLFYPPAWLFLILPLEPVFNLLFIFHLLLGGFGVYFLLHRGHTLSSTAALAGGLTFALNGKWLAHVAGGHVSMVGAIGWMPWAVFGLVMLLKQQQSQVTEEPGRFFWPCLGWVVLVAVALAMQIVTHTLLLIYTVYLLAAMVIWHLLIKGPRAWQRGEGRSNLRFLIGSLLPGFVILILAALLGAVQLLPLAELAGYSNRTLSLSEAADYAVSIPQLLVGLLLPSAEGGHELVIYLGLVPLLLAPFGLSKKNRWSWFYGGLFIFAILFALGPTTPVHSLFYRFAPGFSWVRTPARIFFVGGLAVAVLVGFGLDQLTSGRWSTRTKRWLTRLAVGVGGLSLLLGLGLAAGFGQINRATLGLAIFIPIGLAIILSRVRRVISASPAITLLALLLFLDLVSFDVSMIRFVSTQEALAPGRAPAKYLAQKPGLFRVYSPSYSLPTQTAAAAGLQLADGVEPVHLAVYDRYMARAGGYRETAFSVTIPPFGGGPPESALKETEPNLKLLGLLNVNYLASAFPMEWPGLSPEAEINHTFIYRNDYALPRAWVAHRAMPAQADWLAQLERLPKGGSTVIVQNLPSAQSQSSDGDRRSAARITHYGPNGIELETTITEPGWLVVSEIWYPGWQATVNGETQPVQRVNGLLRGLYLSRPGQYQVRLDYHPQSVRWGYWLSGGAFAIVLVFFLIHIRNQTSLRRSFLDQ